jgi:hypothetical protein
MSATDLVIQKLRWSRSGKRTKDVSDAAEVIRLQGPKLDLAYIRHWTAVYQTAEIFERLLAG